MSPSRRGIVGFVAVCALGVTVSAIYVAYAVRRAVPPTSIAPVPPEPGSPRPTPAPGPMRATEIAPSSPPPRPAPPSAARQDARAPASPRPAADAAGSRAASSPARLLFRSTALGSTYGALGVVPLDALDAPPTFTTLRCERVHAAGGAGVCLTAERGVFTTYRAIIFDTEFRPRHTLRLSGVPSRVRVSPDGRLAAITVFVSGHSYAAATFSTLTSIVDLASGDMLSDDLEKFTVWRDGKRFREVDFNLWGVTFARDSRRFYATLRSGGQTYLIEGDVATRAAHVLRRNVECPSLSPDNTRVAFKKREGGGLQPVTWRLSVLDLETLEDWALSETRSVDDQVEWLDDHRLLYSLPAGAQPTAATDTWAVSANAGGAAPRLFGANTYSAVVLR
jgi:hypothetical protein